MGVGSAALDPRDRTAVEACRLGPAWLANTRRLEMTIDWLRILKDIVLSLVYSGIGVGMFAVSFLLIRLVTPFSIRKEIEEDQNVALAILIGSVILGLAFIISAAIGG
jgi:hypothetical protein